LVAAAARPAASAAALVVRHRRLTLTQLTIATRHRAPRPPPRALRQPKTPSPRRAGNVFPTPGEETGFFFMLPKKKNSATQNEKTTLKTKKNRKAEKHLKLGLPALKLAIAQNPIKGFFKAFFDFSPAEGSVTYAENTVSTRK